ncbi:hypothetical protein [Glaciihabitans sp. UYNi722]|uniref:hypothetical protein n=1 Tax=Glaciihabitans sp. UYNi722 TaxID=3156344 RepID=UPI003395C2D8
MPWWSWVIIWVGLSLAMLAMLGLMAWRLFKKLLGVFRELESLTEKAELLDAASEVLDDQQFERSILLKKSEVVARREYVRARSAERKENRHVARLDRARVITRLDASTRQWFKDE